MIDAADIRELFARAKASADLATVAGTPLFRAGKRLRGECPLCHASKGKKAGGAFSADPRSKAWNCFACGEKGDVIDLEAALSRTSPLEAAQRMAGMTLARSAEQAPVRPAQAPAARQAEALPKAHAWIEVILREAKLAIGTPAAAYLHGRGIEGELVTAALKAGGLLFHPSVPFAWNTEAGAWRRCPAMIARVRTAGGYTGGIHCTYIGRTGPMRTWAKAAIDPAKRMWGPQSDSDGRPGAAWLVGPAPAGSGVLVAEGIESALSAAVLEGWRGRLVATLSLGRLQGGWLTDKYGRLNADAPAADPDKPAFTWPDVTEAVIAVDRDMGAIRVKARRAAGGTYQRELTADERARICAGLAEQAWRTAGVNRVRVIAPGAGRDFNDELMGRIS